MASSSNSTAAASATAVAKASTSAGPSDIHFAFIAVFVCVAFVVLTMIAKLPQTFGRVASENAWKQGWILRFTPPKTRSHLMRQPTSRLRSGYDEKSHHHTPSQAIKRSASQVQRISEHSRQAPRLPPVHVPSWTTILSPFSRYLSARFMGYSFGQVILLAGYAVMIGLTSLLFCNPVKNANRAGWIATSQFPIAIALGTKNSLIGMLIGRGYERLNFMHRWVGQIMFISTLFHVVGYLVKWTKAGSLETRMTRMAAVCGIVALGGMTLLGLVSHPAVRRRAYTLFWHCHWIGVFTLLIGTAYHMPNTLPWVLVSVGIYLLDFIICLVKSHYVTATLHYIPELSSTRVTIPTLSNGWRAGQHVRLTVLCTGMGPVSVIESHPFTIASPSDDDEGLVLLIKSAGDWTKKLAGVARSGAKGEKGFGAGRSVSVIVQGPYGGPGNTMFSSFSAAMIVCGGSGISFGLSAVQEIMRDSFDRACRVRLVDLVWTVQDPSAVVPLLAELKKMTDQASSISSMSLRISIHYTRAAPFVPDYELPADNSITVAAGRPDLSDVLFGSLQCVSALKNTSRDGAVHGVVMAVCGPEGLVSNVRRVEKELGAEVRKAVGGVELVEEAFGW